MGYAVARRLIQCESSGVEAPTAVSELLKWGEDKVPLKDLVKDSISFLVDKSGLEVVQNGLSSSPQFSMLSNPRTGK